MSSNLFRKTRYACTWLNICCVLFYIAVNISDAFPCLACYFLDKSKNTALIIHKIFLPERSSIINIKVLDGNVDRWTDARMDKPSYSDAKTHEKNKSYG